MSKVAFVVLMPERADQHGLLKGGPCGARPPMAAKPLGPFLGGRPLPWVRCGEHWYWERSERRRLKHADFLYSRGLVLAHGGERLDECSPWLEKVISWEACLIALGCALRGVDDGRMLREGLKSFGTVFLLDTRGYEVKL